ncbi:MAG: RecQ family ATP-dependent DNA helicase [Roseiflexaceae bacterium]
MQAPFDLLVTLPDHILIHITGERRRRLVEYLLRWGGPAAALRALDGWLAAQPHLATLREARARVLIELGRAEEALAALDAIDAERGMSESRRALRARALATLGRWDAAHALLAERPGDIAALRLCAELLRQQGRFAAAAECYARAAELMPEGSAPLRGLAELALAQGDSTRAQALLLGRQARLPDTPLATADLFLLRQAAGLLSDAGALASLDAQLHERHVQERADVCDELGLEEDQETRDQETGEQIEAQQASPLHPFTPSPLQAALESELPDNVRVALREHFGYDSFRPGQAAVIAQVLRGEPTLAVLPTGAGKSLTYQLPALLLPGATLVLSPLIALMKDQIDNLPPALAACATTIHSALDGGAIAARLRGLADGRYKLVYVAPERLRQQPFVHALRRAGVARVVVDEAHCVSLWGISFRPDYLFIRRALDALDAPSVLALTATATPDTEAEIKSHLGDMATVRTSIFRPNLRFEVLHAANKREKLAAVVDLCRAVAGPIVVYARSRDACEELAARLRACGVAAEHYHAQVADRHGVQDSFMRGATRVLAATVAFGMGVDKADVRAIIHYNLPQSVEAYYQEAGRAGRDGLPARCILLYAPADKGQLTAWLHEEMLSKDYLREVYRRLRTQLHASWGVVALDDLRRDMREDDETRMRVALGLLERVGLIARHFDLPRAATFLLRDGAAGDAEFQSFVRSARLRPGQPLDVDLLEQAGRAGCAPDEFERRLLRWHDQCWLRYDGAARDALLELRPAVADVGARLDALLAEYAGRQDARIAAIASYARGIHCRHRAIAAHFGETLPRCAGSCDICRPADDQQLARDGASGPATNDWRNRAPNRKPRTRNPASRQRYRT